MSAYASLAQLYTYGAPEKSFGQLTDDQKNNELEASSRYVDTFLRGRYSLPLIAWGVEITEATCKVAAYNLMNVRGYNPASGADANLQLRYQETVNWLRLIQKQQAHPDVTPQPDNTPNYNQPTVISSSVVDLATGATATNRGW